jgi:hypothetical protein
MGDCPSNPFPVIFLKISIYAEIARYGHILRGLRCRIDQSAGEIADNFVTNIGTVLGYFKIFE